MAFYGKRRRAPGPSKNEQKVQRAEEEARRARSIGSIAQRFPEVQRLAVKLQFLSPQGQVLAEEVRELRPADPVNLSAPCPGRCGVGKFDLAAKIESVVTARQNLAEASGVCQEPLYAGSPDSCGCKLNCRIEVTYLPAPSGAEGPAPVEAEGAPPQPAAN